MPKRDRHDQAEIWSADQFEQVMGELSPKMRSLFSICYYTGCRVSEARQLRAEDVVGETLVLRKATTKTKRTRAVPIHAKLRFRSINLNKSNQAEALSNKIVILLQSKID